MRSIPFPSSISWLAAALALFAAGWVVASQLGGSDLNQVAPAGSLIEVHLDDGSVYVGDLAAGEDGWILANPAVVLPSSTEGDKVSYSVQPLTGDPYGIAGPVLIPRDRVLFLGGVRSGSAIDVAYHAARADDPAEPTASPAD